MPRRKQSIRPVRYYLRRKLYAARAKDQPTARVQDNSNSPRTQNENLQGVVHPYPINNILVLPQHSETLINVINPNKKNFSFNQVLKKLSRRKRKEKQRLKKRIVRQVDTQVDIKPDITKIEQKMRKSSMNRHIIILSDSDDDNESKSSKKAKQKPSCSTNSDDDVVLIETNTENEIIEIDDCNEELNNSKTDSVKSQYQTTERNELLSTPESSTSNDFLENSHLNSTPNFNFGLHGSEFKDSEFLKPSVPVDVSESGSVSSVSDIGGSIKANVFNVVDFPKEKDSNLFDENNLEKFKDSITPQRVRGSRNEQKDLPTLSDIKSDENQERRIRGRSIIRELVNDRAYVLLSQKKLKRKRKSKDGCEDTSIAEEAGNESPSLIKKRKKKKKKKDDGREDEIQADVETSPTKTAESKKNKSKKLSTEEKIEEEVSDKQFNIIVRNDLFPGIDSDSSVNSRKSKQKVDVESTTEELEQKKKHKKSKTIPEEMPETPADSTTKRKKEKSVSECSNTENYEDEKLVVKTKKKRKRTLENDDDSDGKETQEGEIVKTKKKTKKILETVDNSEHIPEAVPEQPVNEIEVSEINEVIAPVIKHQKKRLDSTKCENMDQDISQTNLDESGIHSLLDDSEIIEKPCIISKSVEQVENIDKNSDDTIENVLLKSEQACDLLNNIIGADEVGQNNLSQPGNIATEIEILEKPSLECIAPDSCQNAQFESARKRLNSLMSNELNLEGELSQEMKDNLESLNGKPGSVWNMCSSNFFASSESLFRVSDVRTVTDAENIEKIEIPLKNRNSDDIPSSTNVVVSTKSSDAQNRTTTELQNISEAKESVTTVPVVDSTTSENLEQNQVCSNGTSDSMETHNDRVSTSDNNENVPVEVKTEQLEVENDPPSEAPNANTLPGKDVELQNTSEVTVKEEITTENIETFDGNKTSNAGVPTISSSSLVDIEAGNSTNEKTSNLPDVIKNIIQEQDNIKSVTKLCEFLEEVKDPTDVLRKISMIKQAALDKSFSSETNISNAVDDLDVISLASDTSSIVCIENEDPIMYIEDDITLANCSIDTDQPNNELNPPENTDEVPIDNNQSSSSNNEEVRHEPNEIRNDVSEPSTSGLKFGTAGKYRRSLDKYEVEDIQRHMKDDPKLWKICSDDFPQFRPAVRGKRCTKCNYVGHLSNNCPNKTELPKCILCGGEGHLDFKCPNKICTQCGRKSSIMQSVCKYCKDYNYKTCTMCSMRGHPRDKCPDLWRRYHLTVDPGPLVETDGMNLKNKDDLWCSCCSKRGHLEYYCYIAMRNRTFQALDPRIHHYEDVYDTVNDRERRGPSVGGVISKEAMLRLQNTSFDTKLKSASSRTKEYPNKSSVAEENLRRNDNTNIEHAEGASRSRQAVEQQNSSKLKSVLKKSSAVSTSSSGSSQSTNDLQQNGNLGDENDARETQDQSDPRNAFPAIREYLNTSIGYGGNDYFIPNFNLQRLFMEADVALLKDFLRKELTFMKNFPFKVKDMFFKYSAYTKDSQKPENQWEISEQKKLIYNKQLNMYIFGREQLKSGKVNLRKLEVFVNTITGFFTEAMRESLFQAYDYIFSERRHIHTDYMYFLKLLMDKYGYRKLK